MVYTIINGLLVEGEDMVDIHIRFQRIETVPNKKYSKKSLEDFEYDLLAEKIVAKLKKN